MIKNIIFDLGDVFINLDHEQSKKEMQKLGFEEWNEVMLQTNMKYEKGQLSTVDFVNFYISKLKGQTKRDLMDSWNSIILDFPENRLEFLENISGDFRIFLLSNTNELHINYFKYKVGHHFYNRFVNCFEKIYYSFEINCRKPDLECFQLVLRENNLIPSQTLFIDDTLINIAVADELGIHTWHLQPKLQEVVDLFEFKYDLF